MVAPAKRGARTVQDWGDIADMVDRPIVVRSLDGMVIAWNRGAEAVYGWSAAEAIGRPLHDLLGSSHPLAISEVERRLLRDGEWAGEFRRIARSGTDLLIEARCRVRADEAGHPIDVVEVATDIGGLTAIERDARAIEHRYRNMFGGLTAALWELDFGGTRRMLEDAVNAGVTDFRDHFARNPDLLRRSMDSTIVIDINDKTIELYDLPSREAVIGGTISRFWPDASLDVYAESLMAAIEARPYYLAETDLLTWTGRSIRVLHSVAWPKETKGKGTVLVGALDLTALRAAETEKRRTEARYRTIFRSTAVSFWELDFSAAQAFMADLRAGGVRDLMEAARADPAIVDRLLDLTMVRSVNDATAKLFGARRPGDLEGSVRRFWPRASHPDFLRAVAANYRDEHRFETETRMATIDGREIDVIFTAAAPADSAETGTIVIGILDISERIASRAAIDRMRDDLAHAARVAVLGELATSIAHEVNQPLAAIASNAAASTRWLARSEPDLDELRAASTAIARDAERAGDVVSRIRSMAQKRSSTRRIIATRQLVGEVGAFLSHELLASNIELVTQVTDAAIEGDPVQIQQVLINLAMNAVQAMRATGTLAPRLTIGSEPVAGAVAFFVEDNGPGIDPDALPHLFDSFYSTKADGLGIGLAICRSIVEAHGGGIVAERSASGGARFRFTIADPVETAPPIEESEPS